MSCVACRVLRKGCSGKCPLRSSLSGIEGQEAQGHATVFLSKFFGRAGLTSFCSAVPEAQRPALFQSLLYEACGRTINPVYGSVGLLWSGKWHLCQAAVEKVLGGGQLGPSDRAPVDSALAPLPPAKAGRGVGMLGAPQNGGSFPGGALNGGFSTGLGLPSFEGGSTAGSLMSMHSDSGRTPRDLSGGLLNPPGGMSNLNPILLGLQHRDFAQSETRFGADFNADPVVYQASPPTDLGGKLHQSVPLGGSDMHRYTNRQQYTGLHAIVPNRGFPL